MDKLTNTKEMRKFIVVGLGSTMVNYTIFFVFFKILSFYYLLASGAGFLTGLFFSYTFNRLWTFESQNEKKFREFILYASVCLVSLAVSLLALEFQVAFLHIDPLLANIVSIGISAVLNFIGLKIFVFKIQIIP